MKSVVVFVVALVCASCSSAFDGEKFTNSGFGFEYSDSIVQDPEALAKVLGQPTSRTSVDFNSGNPGGYDVIVTLTYPKILVEYYSYKEPTTEHPTSQLKAVYARPGNVYEGIKIGMLIDELRILLPSISTKDNWIRSKSLNEVTFDIKDDRVTMIVWTRGSE